MIAADLGYADIVDILVHRGADRAKRDHDGKSALDLATNSAVREKLTAE
jgi:ankyrin repeat protein